MSQEPVLFADSIFANIAFGCEEQPTLQQVGEASVTCGASVREQSRERAVS